MYFVVIIKSGLGGFFYAFIYAFPRNILQALEEPYDCHRLVEVTRQDMGKIG